MNKPEVKVNVESENLAERFHDTYERLAPKFGYTTRQDTRTFDPDSPNGRLMTAVCFELTAELKAEETASAGEWRRLALQFDAHRMEALWHLKRLVDGAEGPIASSVRRFLSEPPRRGEKVLAERIAKLAAPTVTTDT